MTSQKGVSGNRDEHCKRFEDLGTELVVPIVNSEIWTKLPISSRKADLKMALTQRAIVKSAVAGHKSSR